VSALSSGARQSSTIKAEDDDTPITFWWQMVRPSRIEINIKFSL